MSPVFFFIVNLVRNDYLMYMGQIRKPVKATSVSKRTDFKRFIRKNPKYADVLKTEKDFNNIVKLFNAEVVEEIKRNQYGVIFPETNWVMFLANIGVPKKRIIDKIATEKYGKVIYRQNLMTNNNCPRMVFYNTLLDSTVANSKLYSFYASRPLKDKMRAHFKNHWLRCLNYNGR